MKLDLTYADSPKKYWISTAAHITRTDGPARVGAAIVLVVAVLLAAAMFAVHFVPYWIGWRGL